eukprot:13847693-Heterocapsa_arctica.AAC.1
MPLQASKSFATCLSSGERGGGPNFTSAPSSFRHTAMMTRTGRSVGHRDNESVFGSLGRPVDLADVDERSQVIGRMHCGGMFAEQLRLGLKLLVSREEGHEGSPDMSKRWALKNLSTFTVRE